MRFMTEKYKEEVSQEISPECSRKNLLKQTEGDLDTLEVKCLDTLPEYKDYDWDYDRCYSHKKQKKRKKKAKKKAKLSRQLDDFQLYKDNTNKRLLVLEGKTSAFAEILAMVVKGNLALEAKNIIRLNPEDYCDE